MWEPTFFHVLRGMDSPVPRCYLWWAGVTIAKFLLESAILLDYQTWIALSLGQF